MDEEIFRKKIQLEQKVVKVSSPVRQPSPVVKEQFVPSVVLEQVAPLSQENFVPHVPHKVHASPAPVLQEQVLPQQLVSPVKQKQFLPPAVTK